MPEAGETKGLLLALDGHSDLVTPSSVTEAFRVSDILLGFNMYFLTLYKPLLILSGF